MIIPNNCPLESQKYENYRNYLAKVGKSLEKSSLPDLLCVSIAGAEELNENSKYFRSNTRRRFTAEILARLLGECFAFIAVIENAVLNASYHHVRSALELEITYNWVFHKKSKIDKKIERYFAYQSIRLFLESEQQISNDKMHELEKKKAYWADLFNVDKSDLSNIINWHPKTSYDTMISVYPYSDKIKQMYALFSHMTHLSTFNVILGVDTILGLYDKKGDSSNLESSIFFIMNSLEVLYGFIKNNIGFDSQVKFPKKS